MAGFHPTGPHIVLFCEENCHGEKSDGDVLFAAAAAAALLTTSESYNIQEAV